MATQTQARQSPITAINVTPLVDVMLVLLAIFMLTAKLADEQDAVPLDLPKAASGETVQRILRVAIDADGTRRIYGASGAIGATGATGAAGTTNPAGAWPDGTVLPGVEALRVIAERMHHEYPELRTIIEASSRAEHGQVVGVLDALRLAGISRIAFAVEPKSGQ